MNRRDLIKQIALLTGAAVAGSEIFLSGCKSNDRTVSGFFTKTDISFFDEVAETIIPKTNTPGAKEAEVGIFIASFSTDCYDEAEIETLKKGINELNQAAEKKYSNNFILLNASQKQTLLTDIDREAQKYNEENERSGKQKLPHYFTLMKQMTLLGFFTSKPGTTQVLRYVPVPGKYSGCIEYKKGEPSWA
ncbi:MAG: gluconate 2-dehydrogenase subunit 3 family protein [Chitinophagaceae bacterium]|nr:gluconate 2-dehydrogenase subunit 3 family protein [Chitinophagaceae bacterium]